MSITTPHFCVDDFVPDELAKLENVQTAIPAIAKDARLIGLIEEALGNATDLWAAYREGAFRPSARPWLGYVFILEDCDKSRTALRTSY